MRGDRRLWTRFFCGALTLMLVSFSAWVEDTPAAEGRPGLELGAGTSFLGIHGALLATYRYKENEFYAGPRLFLTRAFNPVEDPYGFRLGYRRYLGEKALQSFLGPEYHITSFRNQIDYTAHEVFWNYGIRWQFSEAASLSNAFGFGVLVEDLQSGSIVELDGLISLSLAYRL